jgi:dCTP deaminase
MALSDKKILAEMKTGNIIIEPFVDKNLGTSSYDLTLGEWFYREQPPNYYLTHYNIFNQKHTEYVWGKKPLRAQLAKEVFKNFAAFEWEGIKPDDKIILMEPGETILAHTNEFIGGRNTITTMMKARSSLGRVFISVCKCAGWGDVGYTNRWTMEISNNSQHYAIPLRVGMRIAQMVFFETGPIRGQDYTATGKYNKTTDIKRLKKEWKPEMMLPRLHADREIQKGK